MKSQVEILTHHHHASLLIHPPNEQTNPRSRSFIQPFPTPLSTQSIKKTIQPAALPSIEMVVQVPLFSDTLLSGRSSQDWIDPFPLNAGQPPPQVFQANGDSTTSNLDQELRRHVGDAAESTNPSTTAVDFQHLMTFPSTLAPGLTSDIKKQACGDEIDYFIQLQNDRLRRTISHQNHQQITTLLHTIQSKIEPLILKAESELLKSTTKTRQLTDYLRKAELEAELWQRIARENESLVIALNQSLNRLTEAQKNWPDAGTSAADYSDAESVCDREQEQEQTDKRGGDGMCKWCKLRGSCVVLLPCKHLCACVACGAAIRFCPVCNSVKEGCIEVLFCSPS